MTDTDPAPAWVTTSARTIAANQLARIFEHGRPEALENLMLYLRLQTLFIDLKPGIVENINTLEQLTAQIDGHLGYAIEQWGGGAKPQTFSPDTPSTRVTATVAPPMPATDELEAAQARRAKALECAVHLLAGQTEHVSVVRDLARKFLTYIEEGNT